VSHLILFNRKERKDSTKNAKKLCDLSAFFGNSAVKKQKKGKYLFFID